MPQSARKPARTAAARLRFTPVATRARHDGWTPERQLGFVDALAQSGCVEEACAAVGLSRQSAYALRTRPDAQGFRMAWDAALDLAVRRLSDACFSRALQGEAIPHFYQGSQVGEHRRYDNRLAMFLLRYRDPLRYAATLDQMVYAGHPETAAVAFAKARGRVADEAWGVAERSDADAGSPPWEATPVRAERARQQAVAADAARLAAADAACDQARRDAAIDAELKVLMDDFEAKAATSKRAPGAPGRPPARRRGALMECTALAGAAGRRMGSGGGASPGDVASSSSTSAARPAAGEGPAPPPAAATSAEDAATRVQQRQVPRIRSF